MTTTTQKNRPEAGWVEIRDTTGKLLFKYDPFENVIQIKRDGHVQAIELNRIRAKYGFVIPEKAEVIFGSEVV